MNPGRLLFALLLGLTFSSCRSTKPQAEATVRINDGILPTAVRPDDVAAVDAWKAKGNKGGFHPQKLETPLTPANARFIVDLDAQRAYLYQGSCLIAYSPISSGRRYYRTETGDYTIGQKNRDHRSTSYGNFVSRSGGTIMSDVQNGFDPLPVGARFEGSLMKWFMRLHHNGKSTPMGFHRGVLPGHPASHGCIRLPGTMAQWFFENVPQGVTVLVRGEKNGIPIGKSQGRPKRSPRVHSSLKKPKEETPSVPPAPESDINSPEPSAPAPAGDPTPAAPAAPEAPAAPAAGGDPTPAAPGSN